MKKVLFVTDFLKEDLPSSGGAERCDQVLIDFLNSKTDLELKRSKDLTKKDVVLHTRGGGVVILSNFVNVPKEAMIELIFGYPKHEYIIFEHDHKYLSTRDPSAFPNFQAPDEHVINEDLYANAKAVVCLSKIHKEVLCMNLKSVDKNKVHSIGTSLWSQGCFNHLKKLCSNEKRPIEAIIIDSDNPIKGTPKAIKYAKEKDLDTTIISSESWHDLMTQMSLHQKFIFFPQVLETFSRISAEAKMLGLKLVTRKKLLGAASEEVFKLSGMELIEELEKRTQAACDLFWTLINASEEEKREVPTESEDLTVILNAYRRPQLLQEQIDAINNQTMKPKEIWVWVNAHEDNKDLDFSILESDIPVKWFRSNHNWKYHGRFAAAYLADTKFLAFADDDTIPGASWFENCFATMDEVGYNSILGTVGVKLQKKDSYFHHERVGWPEPNKKVEEVDLVGHFWFTTKEVIRDFLSHEPISYENGEDIQLSAFSKISKGTKTYVPPHPQENIDLWGSVKGMEYGIDMVASSNVRNHAKFYAERDSLVKNLTKKGWKIVKFS